MMVTNIISSPKATITLEADTWTRITSTPSKVGTAYFCSAFLHVSGGSAKVAYCGDEAISSDRRVSFNITASNEYPIGMYYSVVSGNPTVTVTNMLLCTLDEYQANKTLLDSINYFDGDSMPLA